ncbi:DUF6020 family protein [Bifidobacterium jacchi]|uniref:Uncharacterized protein n=1 Tax=Bifidobacterium jacchi TaxID=2490545 RepID=A0A5N5RKJ1_9BIFI|nr:DUF6020 family protein [Bifidobacterium jacchi]KAB5607450.1 hypothetical protein EHS19_04595 [Bifidobacterium jacchi]
MRFISAGPRMLAHGSHMLAQGRRTLIDGFAPSGVPRILVCLAGAAVVVMADNAATHADIGPFDLLFMLRIALLFCLLAMLFAAGERLLLARRGRSVRDALRPRTALRAAIHAAAERALRWWRGRGRLGRLLAATALMAACWLPYVIMLLPGTIWFDTGDQIAQFLGISAYGQPIGTISSHHPPLDTLVFGGVAWLGERLTGDYQNGLAVYVIVQLAATCLGLSAICLYVHRIGAGRAAATAMFVFFAVFPAFPIFTMSIVKDTLHQVVLIPWLLMVVETARTRLAALRSARWCAALLCVSVLTAATSATGLYVVVLSLAALPFTSLKTAWNHGKPRGCGIRLRLIAVLLTAATLIISAVGVPAAVRLVVPIAREDANQALVVPMQMTARWMLDHADEATAQERAAIDRVNEVSSAAMPYLYNPYLADPIIQYELRDSSADAVGDYLRVWAAQGARDPMPYLNAFASLESGWFSLRRTPLVNADAPFDLDMVRDAAPGAIGNQMLMQTWNPVSHPFAALNRALDQQTDPTPPYAFTPYANTGGQRAAAAVWDALCAIPVVSALTYTAVWTFLMPLFLLFCAAGGRRRRGLRSGSPCRSAGDRDATQRPDAAACPWTAAMPLVWSLLALLPSAISVPLKPTATRYMLWALFMVPFYLCILRAARLRTARQGASHGVRMPNEARTPLGKGDSTCDED